MQSGFMTMTCKLVSLRASYANSIPAHPLEEEHLLCARGRIIDRRTSTSRPQRWIILRLIVLSEVQRFEITLKLVFLSILLSLLLPGECLKRNEDKIRMILWKKNICFCAGGRVADRRRLSFIVCFSACCVDQSR